MPKKLKNVYNSSAVTFFPAFDVAPSDDIHGAGTKNYEELENLPSLNGVTVIGRKSNEDYGISSLTDMEIEVLLKSSD